MVSDATFRLTTAHEWDDERGVLSSTSELVRHEIEVRTRLEDAVLRAAVILELERQGYTVLAPED